METEAPGARPIRRENDAPSGDPEAGLVRAAQADPAQFDVLYQQYFPRVQGYVRVRLRDRSLGEDVTSQVFLTALEQIHAFRGEGSFAAWLFRIAQHGVQRAYRQQAAGGPPSPEAAEDPLAALADSAPGPEEHVLAQERRAALRDLLGGLDPAQQHLLALRFGADLSTREIAQILGKSGVAVRVSLYRTLHALRRRYHDED